MPPKIGFDLFGGKGKTQTSNQPTPKKEIVENQRRKDTVPKSDKNLSLLIIEELKKQNLDSTYEEFPNHFNFYVYEDEWKLFDQISKECEKKLFSSIATPKVNPSLDSKITTAGQTPGTKNSNANKPNQKIFSAIISEEIKNIMEELLKKENIPFKFEKENGKLYVDFYENDSDKVQQIADEAYGIYSAAKADEAIKKKEKEHVEKINDVSAEDESAPKYDVVEEEQPSAGRKRKHQMKIWMDDKEREIILKNIEISGKSQSAYIREMAMNGKIKVVPSAANDIYLLKRIESMEGTLGKISGAIVKIMQTTKESNCLTKEERDELQKEIYALRKLKSEIKKEVKTIWH